MGVEWGDDSVVYRIVSYADNLGMGRVFYRSKYSTFSVTCNVID